MAPRNTALRKGLRGVAASARRPPRIVLHALGALVAFALWALASALWSDAPGLAVEGANKVLLYAIVLAIVALARRPGGRLARALGVVAAESDALALALGVVAAGLGVLAAGVLVGAGSDPGSLFVDGRLAEPAGYANATASLWLVGVWPALALACGSRLAIGARAGALGVACLLAEVSLLSGSRGAVGAMLITAVLFVALGERRARAIGALAVLAGCVLLTAGRVLGVGEATSASELAAALGPARTAIAWTSVLAAALAAAGMLLARRVPADMLLAFRVRGFLSTLA